MESILMLLWVKEDCMNNCDEIISNKFVCSWFVGFCLFSGEFIKIGWEFEYFSLRNG